MLFVPGSDPRKLGKIPALGAQAVLLDLEDGVAASAKAQARLNVVAALSEHCAAAHCWVRVNPMDSAELYDDLQSVVVPGLAGLNLPKVSSARDLHVLDWVVGELERRRGLAAGSVGVMATIETAEGLGRLDEIADAGPRLRGLCIGAADLSRDLGLDWPPPGGSLSQSLIQAKVALVHASRRFGLEPPHDGASAELRDLERLRLEAEGARALGFGGKHAIHPAQLPVIEAAFRPTQAQLDWARRVVEAFEEHERRGVGAFELDGRMVDAPVAERARQILRQGETGGVP